MQSSTLLRFFTSGFALRLCLALVLGAMGALSSARPALAQSILWEDDFPTSSSTVDASKWAVTATGGIGRTQFGDAPLVTSEGSTTFARMRLHSYNPAQPGQTFQGTEIWSKPSWSMGPGLEYEARVRGTNVPKGLCYAFFSYKRRDFGVDRDQEEIDFEFLSNFIKDPAQSGKLWTNIWNGTTRSAETQPTVAGLDQTAWHTYVMRWLNTKVEWLVDGVVVRTETNIIPDDQMAVCFNIWAVHPSWSPAYSSTLTTSSTAATDNVSYFDVDYVKVRQLAPAANQGSIGGGAGLTSTYYNAAAFNNGVEYSDEKYSVITPRINFSNWSTARVDSRLGADNWGAVFKGGLQPQYSESTTLYLSTQTSDGARLYLNGNLLIDKRPAAGTDELVESTVTVSLQAGRYYPIRIEFYDGIEAASLKLAWSSASLPKQFVATTQLYPVQLSVPTLSPPPQVYYSPQTVTVTNSEPGVDMHYTTDGSDPSRTSTSIASGGTLTISSNTRLKVKAWKDGFWSSEVIDASYFIVTDAQAPTVSISSPTNTWSYRTLASATGTVSENGNSGLDRVAVRLQRASDSAFWNPVTSTWSAAVVDMPATLTGAGWSVALPALADGSYNLRAMAYDRAGNGADSNAGFFIDTTAPTATIGAPLDNAFFATSPTQASGGATDVGPGVSAVRAALKRLSDGAWWNGSAWSPSSADWAASFGAPNWTLALPPLGDGKYLLSVTPRDYAGNTGVAVSRTFTVDTVSPTVAIVQPTNNALLKSALTLSGRALDATSGASSVVVRVQRSSDGAWWNGSNASGWSTNAVDVAANTSPSAGNTLGLDWSLTVPVFGDGIYTAAIVARDRAGNAGQSSVGWRFDGTAPVVSVGAPTDGATWSGWSPPRGSVSDGANGSGVDFVEVALRSGSTFWNGNAWAGSYAGTRATLSGSAWSWPAGVSLPPNVNGAYEVLATALDNAGNTSTDRSGVTLAVPTPGPTATPTTKPAATPTTAPEPTATPGSEPTATPTATAVATAIPTATAVGTPTPAPTALPPGSDRVPPQVRLLSPAFNSSWLSVPPLRGVASDNVAIAKVEVALYRYSDRRYWTGRVWSPTFVALQASLNGTSWWYTTLPVGGNVLAGRYAAFAIATDRAGLRATSSSVFHIDRQAPVVSFAAPTASLLTAMPSRVLVRAVDNGAGTRAVDLLLWRRSDGRYWNGRSWQPGLARLAMRGINPTRGATPVAVLWENALALPAAASAPAGSYAFIAIARDWLGNQSTARLDFLLAPPSPFGLSSASALAANSAISVAFSGPLDAVVAQNRARYLARVNGVARSVLAARYSPSTRTVTLTLAGAIAPQAHVEALWNGLRDLNGQSVRDGLAATVAQ